MILVVGLEQQGSPFYNRIKCICNKKCTIAFKWLGAVQQDVSKSNCTSVGIDLLHELYFSLNSNNHLLNNHNDWVATNLRRGTGRGNTCMLLGLLLAVSERVGK